jgi:hypothetical protein
VVTLGLLVQVGDPGLRDLVPAPGQQALPTRLSAARPLPRLRDPPTFWFDQQIPADDGEIDDQAFWDNYGDAALCSYYDRTGDLRSTTKLSDFYSARQWHSTGLYTDYFRLYGTEHQLLMVLPAGPGPTTGPGRTIRLEFCRDERGAPDFSSATARCWHCCARTCTRPTSTPNGAAGARPR